MKSQPFSIYCEKWRLGPLHLMLADASSPRGSDATLASVSPLSEGFERFVASPLLPRRLRAMGRTV